MTAALTPALALEFITALSADVRTAVVLDAQRAHLAGPPALAAPARAFLAQARAPERTGEATHIQGTTSGGAVHAACDARHTIVVVTGRFALPRVTRHDLETALTALGGETARNSPSRRAPEAATRAVLEAARDHFRLPRAV